MFHQLVDSEYVDRGMEYVSTPVKAFLKANLAEPDYTGLSIKDVQQMANSVRVAPPPGAAISGVHSDWYV